MFYIEFAFGWSPVAELEFDFDADGWWYGSKLFDSHEEISKFWHSEMGYEFVSEKDKREREIDSLINAHICEVSEGMMSYLMSGNMNSIQYKLNIFLEILLDISPKPVIMDVYYE